VKLGLKVYYTYSELKVYIYTNLYSRIKVCIKKIIQSHFTCVFIGDIRLDNFLYAVMQVCVDIPLRRRPYRTAF